MRFLILILLLLGACSNPKPDTSGLASGLFAGEGRNALCITGTASAQRGGFIVYGKGETNCSARGRIEREGTTWALIPSGEGDCRIPFSLNADRIALGPAHPSCAYYCGPGASFAGSSFRLVRSSDALAAARNPMTDLAGEPLC